MDNRLVLGGRVSSPPVTRRSPAGIPITRFSLRHQSRQREADMARMVECSIEVVVSGKQLQTALRGMDVDSAVRVTGFLARSGYRQGEHRLTLHAERIELLQTETDCIDTGKPDHRGD